MISSKFLSGALVVLGVVGASVGIPAVTTSIHSQSNSTPSYTATKSISLPKIEKKTETADSEIPYNTKTVSDNSLAKGTKKTKVSGENGIERKIYEVTYVDGKEDSRKLISNEIIKEPVDEVIAEGTYVKPVATNTNSGSNTTTTRCQNGTYTNTYGNKVCRPSSSNTGGATARCRDGSYSYSQTRRGTCSHHGGVAAWL